LGRNGIFAPEEIAQHWNSIVDFTDAEHPTVMNDSLDAVQRIMADDRRD